MRSLRLLLILTASTAGIAAAQPPLQQGGAASSPAATAIAPEPPSQPWAQDASDIPADAAVRFGTLPNGMRYAIMHNATPPGQAALRLHINAGSLMEKEDQLGLAHFMEHMAFNGTTNIPENELVHILERLGLAFGADNNAFTSFDQTGYVLALPRTNDETVDTGLRIMREQVSEALMEPKAIDEERGVIAGEERTRNSPGLRLQKRLMPIISKGQKIANRFPIGDLEIIRTAPRERFVDFYNSYYRPSRATLIAVGDFDVAAMEAKIVRQFADWQPKGPNGPEPDLGAVQPRGPETHILVEPGVPSSVSLSWLQQPDLSPDTIASRRADRVRSLGRAVLNRRLSELSRTDNAPFLSSQSSQQTIARSFAAASINAAFIEGRWKTALEAIDQEQRRIVEYGVTQDELDREINKLRTSWDNAVKSAPTRETQALANQLLGSANDRTVFSTPQTNRDLFEADMKNVTVAEVNAALKEMFTGQGPLTIMTSPKPVEGGEQAVAAAYAASQKVAVAALTPPVKMAWPYTDFGKPGTVTGKRVIKELGATIVTFANGTVLTVKPTKFDKDQISVGVLTGAGERNFSPDKWDPRAMMINTLILDGLGKMTADDVSLSLNGHIYGGGLAVLGDRFMLSGGTRGSDLQLEMQYLAAYLTDPAFRPNSFNQAKAGHPAIYDMLQATPGGAFAVKAKGLLASGDKRETLVTPDVMAKWTVEAVRPDLKAMLAEGPLHVTIVGDVTVARAIAVTANTLGALPRRPAVRPPAPNAEIRRFPAPTAEPLRMTHTGTDNQAMGVVAWPTVDSVEDVSEARRIEVLSAVMRLRGTDEIRERLGIAYSPGVSAGSSDSYKGYGTLSINSQVAPEKLPDFFAAVDRIAQDLRDKPISEDELTRAREPILKDLLRSRTNNGWWFRSLYYINARPHYIPQILKGPDIVGALTTADIQALARKYLRPETAWKALVEPEAGKGNSPIASK